MGISEDIKKLEKQAKEAEYWKDKYVALRDTLTDTIKQLTSLVYLKTPTAVGTTKKLGKKLVPIYDELLADLKAKDGYEVGKKEITQAFEKLGVDAVYHQVFQVRDALKVTKNTAFRKLGRDTRIYYVDQSKQEPEVKINGSYMGVKR